MTVDLQGDLLLLLDMDPYIHTIIKLQFEEIPIIDTIRDYIKNTFGIQCDYCLGSSVFNGRLELLRHNDKEALNSNVVSVSFGATRVFELRNIGQTQGWVGSFNLNSGESIHHGTTLSTEVRTHNNQVQAGH